MYNPLSYTLRNSPYCALQLDESTDISDLSDLLARYVDEDTVQEEMPFCRQFKVRTAGRQKFNLTDAYFDETKIAWSRCIGVCTDGVTSVIVTGKYNRFVSQTNNVTPNISWTHCSIHREALAAKARLKD
jgi:hypothetical protein